MPDDKALKMNSSPGALEGCLILRLTGPLVLPNIFDFQTTVRADNSRFLIVDLAGVPYVDSAGIGALVGAVVSRQRGERRMALVAVNDRVRGSLQITQVLQFFSVFPSIEDAEKALAAAPK